MSERTMNGLNDGVGIVTGAASGIGRASAKRLASEGVSVVVGDLDEDGGNKTVEMIEDEGGEATFVEADVTDMDSVSNMVEVATETYGTLTVAHNNAGIEGANRSIDEYSEEEWEPVLDVNLSGVWRCLKAELPAMSENGGAVVNTASMGGKVVAGVPPYVSSKHGVIGITRSAAAAYSETGVRVNAVCPGVVDTPMVARAGEGSGTDQMIEGTPLGRPAQAEEIASAVAYLLSEDASYVNGHPMLIDGGFTAL